MADMFFPKRIYKSVGGNKLDAVLINREHRLYQLQRDFVYHLPYKECNFEFRIPKGFITNFASVPKQFWNLFHPVNEDMLVASCIHDYLLGENLHIQEWVTRVVTIDGVVFEVDKIMNGYQAADIFIEVLKKEASYSEALRIFLSICVKGYYFMTLNGYIKPSFCNVKI